MRGVTTFAHRPVDPRSRRVVATQRDSHTTVLQLECGHSIFRKPLCAPERAICDRCPPAGGLGGNRFALPQSSHGGASTTGHPGRGAGKAASISTKLQAGR